MKNSTRNLHRDPNASPTLPPELHIPLLPTISTYRRVAASVEVSSPSILYTLPYITYSNWSALGRVKFRYDIAEHSLREGTSAPHPPDTMMFPVGPPYLDGLSSVGLYSPSSSVPSSYKVLAMTRRNLSPGKRGQRSSEKVRVQPQQISVWWQGDVLAGLAQTHLCLHSSNRTVGNKEKVTLDHLSPCSPQTLATTTERTEPPEHHCCCFHGIQQDIHGKSSRGLGRTLGSKCETLQQQHQLFCASLRIRLFST